MLTTKTINKKALESIIHETFCNFGSISSSSLLDSLKFLGFSYATNAGISINIEDLKTPIAKKQIINEVSLEMKVTSQKWEEGFLSDIERFQTIIDSWNNATESLKNKIIDYYQSYDPVNNLYIMAFSGARGNMSQVRQLVGMRGLMSDQEGNIIDLPIQTNFREGLSSLDYIISSYGARKGIVDTALKTADSGYLTRRLIYVAQDLIIREIDCKTQKGIFFLLNSKTSTENLVGRVIVSLKSFASSDSNVVNFLKDSNQILTSSLVKNFKKSTPLYLVIRSPLTCESAGSICQRCYGYDLSQNRFISLGSTVGITAAQSIGEPGTQLTMRTFHTGGIFTSELLEQTKAPFSGKLIIPEFLKTTSYRNNHGQKVFKIQQEISLKLENWKGKREQINLPIGSFLYKKDSHFLKKNQIICESSNKSVSSKNRKLKPIYSNIEGEIKVKNLLVRYIFRANKAQVKINQDDGILWLTSGKIFSIPKESRFHLEKKSHEKKAFASLNLSSSTKGLIILEKENIFLKTKEGNQKFTFSLFNETLKNAKVKIIPIIKNYQLVDAYTILATFFIYPEVNKRIYFIRKKESNVLTTFFLVTEDDVWKLNSDQLNNFNQTKTILRSGSFFNATSLTNKSGFFFKKNGFQYFFQNATPIFLTRGALLNYKKGDFVFKNSPIATLIKYKQQTEDIVQGLPKIEELLEARVPLIRSFLMKKPGVFLHPENIFIFRNLVIEKNCEIFQINLLQKKKLKKQKKFELFSFVEKLENKKKNNGYRKDIQRIEIELKKVKIIRKKGQEKRKKMLFRKINQKYQLFNPIKNYKIPIGLNVFVNSGQFVDIGEPLTDGMIDPHELLSLLFSYHQVFDGTLIGCLKSINKFQLILLNSIQGIYVSQGVIISSKHVEIVLRQMTNKVCVKESGKLDLFPNEFIRLPFMTEMMKSALNMKDIKKIKSEKSFSLPKYEPAFLSVTHSSLSKDGFLSSAGFQETKRVLIKAAIEGTSDWLRGLKESIILGRMIPAGSAYLNYKHYLDNYYYFKNNKKVIKDE